VGLDLHHITGYTVPNSPKISYVAGQSTQILNKKNVKQLIPANGINHNTAQTSMNFFPNVNFHKKQGTCHLNQTREKIQKLQSKFGLATNTNTTASPVDELLTANQTKSSTLHNTTTNNMAALIRIDNIPFTTSSLDNNTEDDEA
jgi:hypothetical protein